MMISDKGSGREGMRGSSRQSIQRLRITYSQGGNKHPTYNKKERRATGMSRRE
jgi:hypothetical protein